ncbi:MAG: tetratricopeptide repeat protein [Bacteroidota bacterium]
MKLGKIISFLLVGAVIFGCGTKKNAQEKKVSTNEKGFSKADFAYIEKFHEGVRLKTKGQLAEAIQSFEACLVMKQTDDAVYYALSELYLEQGNPQKSGEAIKKAAKLDPDNLHYTSELAYYYIEKEQYNEAIVAFEKLVKAQPRNPEVLYPYAECLVRAGKTQEAIKQLNKTEDQVGVIPEISIQKFQLYRLIKEDEKALNELNKAREEYPQDPQLLSTLVDYYFAIKQEDKALSTLEELAAADPSNARVHLFIADIYRRKGDKDKFYPSLKKAFEGEGLDEETKMKVLISLQNPNEAIDPRAIELAEIFVLENPESAKAHSVMGDYLLELKRDDEALASYKKALSYEKGSYALWNQVLIMEYQSQKFYELAIDSKEALKYFPNNPSFYLLNGVGNVQIKSYEAALANLEVGKEYAINDKPLLGEFYGQIAEAYFGLKDFKKGKENYAKALEKDPSSFLLMNNYAYRLASENIDLVKAEELIKKVNEKSPNQPQFLDTYGFILFKKGDFKGAMNYYEKAYEMDSQDILLLDHMGDASIQLNNIDDALKYWNKAKSLGSKNKILDKKIENTKYYEPVF